MLGNFSSGCVFCIITIIGIVSPSLSVSCNLCEPETCFPQATVATEMTRLVRKEFEYEGEEVWGRAPGYESEKYNF